MPPALTARTELPLESKVAFLRQPSSYPEPIFRVEAMETHMSWVFLADDHAYKLKKPACHDLLDFRTLAARKHFCEEEVRLNRRLAEDVYLGVVALTIDARDHLQLDGSGTAVDWLVRMRRLPLQGMLDYTISNGTATADHMRKIATRLTAFYRNCPSQLVEPNAYRSTFQRAIERNLKELSRPEYGLQTESVRDLCTAQLAFLDNRKILFDERIRAGRIVEGHGDLRPEHVCLEPEVKIIDCLEFSRELRIVDPVDELGFLALECERLGASDLGKGLLDAYSEMSGDRPDPALIHFYQGYRAALRARIAIKHLDEEKFRYSAEWRRRAGDYLHLAQSYQT